MTWSLPVCQYLVYMEFMKLVNDRTFQMRASDEWLRKLDDWRRLQPDIPSRAEAIRRLVHKGIDAQSSVGADRKSVVSGKSVSVRVDSGSSLFFNNNNLFFYIS